jgi:hypothetical protein
MFVPSLVVIVLIECVPWVGEAEECACSAAAAGAVDVRLAAARTPAPPTKTLRREVVVTVEIVRSFMESSCLWLVNNEIATVDQTEGQRHLARALGLVPALHVQ